MGKLRLLLAISVIIAHTTPIFGVSLIGGVHAVHLFYIISGFYMSMILNEKYTGRHSYRLFITNRFLRLYPVYWAVLIITIVFSFYLYAKSGHENGGLLSAFFSYFDVLNKPWKLFLILVNVLIIGQDLVMFMGMNSGTGNLLLTTNFRNSNPPVFSFLLVPQAWTLAIELCFYLVAPFLLRRSVRLICTLIAVAFALRLISFHFGFNYDPWNNRFFPFELGFFLLGNLAYRIYIWLRINNLKTIYYPLSVAILFLVVIFFYHLPFKTPVLYAVTFICIPVIFLGSKLDKIDRMLGELSYPVYISHYLLIQVALYLDIPRTGLFITIFSVLFSILLNEIISRRVENLRQRRMRMASGLTTAIRSDHLIEHSTFVKTSDVR
ncbi:MAG TPA: acyltransferase [Puia sp.]|nr:acyltransferase [Puia sp.]